MRSGWKCIATLGCGCLLVGAAQAITLYQSSTLALYTLEAPSGARNTHPVNFVDAQSLAQLLASLQLESAEAGGPVYLMSENHAIKAGAELAKALARVDTDRDVLLVSYRSVGSFPAARRLATAARVFAEGERLNLIFGQIDEFIDDFREPYSKIARPGTRVAERRSGGSIRTANWFAFKAGRDDWIEFPIDMAQSPRTTLRLKAVDTGAKAVPVGVPVHSSVPAVTDKPVTPLQPAPVPEASRWRDLEEGLETLQRLRDKGLLTEEEFQAKRKLLLDGVQLSPVSRFRDTGGAE